VKKFRRATHGEFMLVVPKGSFQAPQSRGSLDWSGVSRACKMGERNPRSFPRFIAAALSRTLIDSQRVPRNALRSI
jgi:hypothetical protein